MFMFIFILCCNSQNWLCSSARGLIALVHVSKRRKDHADNALYPFLRCNVSPNPCIDGERRL